MQTVAEAEFVAHPLAYLHEAENEQGLVICNEGQAIALVLPLVNRSAPREFGVCRGEFTVPEDFNAPLPEELLRAFEGNLGD